MKKLQRLCVAGVFTLALTTASFGGDIETPGKTQPPPTASSTLSPGDIDTPGIQNPQGMSDSVADIALNLLQIMLLVF